MNISKEEFLLLSAKEGISPDKAQRLWTGISQADENSKNTSFNFIGYLGALIIIAGFVIFLGLNWDSLTGGSLLLLSSSYMIILAAIGSYLWKKAQMKIPGGLLIAMAVATVPLAVYGLNLYLDLLPNPLSGRYLEPSFEKELFMSGATLLAGIVALRFFPFFLILLSIYSSLFFVLCFALLGFGIDPWIYQDSISFAYGFILIVCGFLFDRKGKIDFGFWSYLIGVWMFWASMSALVWDKGDLAMFGYFIANLIMVLSSMLLQRMVLAFFGSLGIFAYMSYLSYKIFNDTIWYPVSLVIIGLCLVAGAFMFQKFRREKKQ